MANLCPCTMGSSVAGALFNLKNAKKLNQEALEQTASACVLSRRVDTVYSLTKSSSSWAYLVKFRLESGEEIELNVREESYAALKEYTPVCITWQGDTLTAFTEA